MFLISVETTKSVYDVNSPSEGYIFRLASNDEILDIGAPLTVISNNKDDSIVDIKKWIKENEITKKHIESSKKVATKKAIILASKHGISIDDVMTDGDRVTEKDVIIIQIHKNYPTSASGTMLWISYKQ